MKDLIQEVAVKVDTETVVESEVVVDSNVVVDSEVVVVPEVIVVPEVATSSKKKAVSKSKELQNKIDNQIKLITKLTNKLEEIKSKLLELPEIISLEVSKKILLTKIDEIQKKIDYQVNINSKLKEEYYKKKEAEKKRLEEIRLLEEELAEKKRILQGKKDNAVIPFKIFQTWCTSVLPSKMKEAVMNIRKNNPEFEYIFHDDNQCREFIANHFPDMVLYAFDNLVPGPYKADIWRYCVLYIHGGIYLNINFEPVDNFKLLEFVDQEYFVLDRYINGINNDAFKIGIYNGLIAVKPKNEILKLALNQIIKTVISKNYAISPLHVSGSGLLGSLIHKSEDEYSDFYDNYKLKLSKCGNYIVNNQDGTNLLKSYNTYRQEQYKNQKNLHHDVLWTDKKIYVVKNMNNCVLINAIM
jgi:mannosyltransferase OCH1-like enzyme